MDDLIEKFFSFLVRVFTPASSVGKRIAQIIFAWPATIVLIAVLALIIFSISMSWFIIELITLIPIAVVSYICGYVYRPVAICSMMESETSMLDDWKVFTKIKTEEETDES